MNQPHTQRQRQPMTFAWQGRDDQGRPAQGRQRA